jgi:hypothetical protein
MLFDAGIPHEPASKRWIERARWMFAVVTFFALVFVTPLDPVFNSLSGGFPVDASTAAERIVTGPMLTGGPPLIGYTFDLTVYFPDQIDKIYQLYRVDVGWTTVSEEDP